MPVKPSFCHSSLGTRHYSSPRQAEPRLSAVSAGLGAAQLDDFERGFKGERDLSLRHPLAGDFFAADFSCLLLRECRCEEVAE
jgi:hypothetical protein